MSTQYSASIKEDYPHPTINEEPPRPTLVRENSIQTRYVTMLLDLDNISSTYNIYAAFFTWFLLAGCNIPLTVIKYHLLTTTTVIILPSTFTSLSALDDNPTISSSQVASTLVKQIKNVPLLYFAAFCSGIGSLGMSWLWFRYRTNYVWIINRIFLPGCLHSLAGLISTFVNVYSSQHGHWSVTAWATATATGGAMLITGALFSVYNFWMLAKVKQNHQDEMQQINKIMV